MAQVEASRNSTPEKGGLPEMTNTLVFPLPLFQTLLRMLAVEPDRVVLCHVGISRLESETRYLVRRVENANAPQANAGDIERSLCVSTMMDFAQLQTLPVSEALGLLLIGSGTMQGQLWGILKNSEGATEALHRILLVGAGMHEFLVSLPSSTPERVERTSSIPMRQAYPRFSRTIGALGARPWRRLVSLHIAIIGCGRTGSISAVTLAKLGVRALTLIDPDVVEEHNLAEMDGVHDADVGRLKVEALADFLRAYCAPADAPLHITTIPQPITTAHHAALSADVLFCCVDNDAARLACGILATLFHKVLLDIGTGIFNEGNNNRTAINRPPRGHPTNMGADVRLILPADGCLLCFGNVANYDEGIKNLIWRNLSPENSGEQEQWWLRRSGSLQTLNMMAVSVGVQLLCDLVVSERAQNSRWARLEYDASGHLSVQQTDHSDTQASSQCPLCAKAGMGDDGLLW